MLDGAEGLPLYSNHSQSSDSALQPLGSKDQPSQILGQASGAPHWTLRHLSPPFGPFSAVVPHPKGVKGREEWWVFHLRGVRHGGAGLWQPLE